MESTLPKLSSLYISPLSQCNLNCKVCYTQKTASTLSQEQILDFVERFRSQHPLELITFCGGEVFLLDWFVELVNKLTAQDLLAEIITNGTIDRLDELTEPNSVNLIVSLDGLKREHDLNRGKGNFEKTWKFVLKAIKLGFHLEIFSVLTQHNFDLINEFENWIEEELGRLPKITYHPRKSLEYLTAHPFDNIKGEVEEFGFLQRSQVEWLYQEKEVFPPLGLGCHQLSVMSDGKVYACCEGVRPIGHISDNIEDLVESYSKLLMNFPHCPEPEFMCGMNKGFFSCSERGCGECSERND